MLSTWRQWLRRWRPSPPLLPPLLYMLAIFGLSSVPGVIPEDAPAPYQIFNWAPPQVQNLLHIPVYAGLAFYGAGRWRRCCGRRRRPSWPWWSRSVMISRYAQLPASAAAGSASD